MKTIKSKNRKLLSNIIIVFLIVALPLFVWAVLTQRFDLRKRASSAEPSVCIADINKVITVMPNNVHQHPNGAGCHDIQTAINAATGDGYTVLITPGEYYVYQTIDVNSKSNITITGDSQYGSNATTINFSHNSWGFLVQNSSGSLNWLNIQGGSANGMLSVIYSNNFSVGNINIYSQNSHTFDIQNSSNISVHNTNIQSSAGALEIHASNNVSILNNTIHNSATGVSVRDSQDVDLNYNLIYSNRDSGITLYNVSDAEINHNTIHNNAVFGSSYPAVDLFENIERLVLTENLITYNHAAGIRYTGNNFTRTIGNNDLFNNLGGNYVGFSNYTGINGNISQDPLMNFTANEMYCLLPGSPAIYVSHLNLFMGHKGPCSDNLPVADDIYFKDSGNSVSFRTTDRNPNVSVDPTNLVPGTTYALDVIYSLQNITKSQDATSSAIPVIVLVNGEFKSDKDITYSLIANHADGASDSQSMSFMAQGNTTNIEVIFDPNNIFPETNENNNTLTFNFTRTTLSQCNDTCLINTDCSSGLVCQLDTEVSVGHCRNPQCTTSNSCSCVTSTPSPSPTPIYKIGDVNMDNRVNLIDIGIVIDYFDQTTPANPRADVNASGRVNLIDIGLIIDNYEW